MVDLNAITDRGSLELADTGTPGSLINKVLIRNRPYPRTRSYSMNMWAGGVLKCLDPEPEFIGVMKHGSGVGRRGSEVSEKWENAGLHGRPKSR
jgi:hypothetical protein